MVAMIDSRRACSCEKGKSHQVIGTGAVFYHSLGYLECTWCGGVQAIRKVMPIKHTWTNSDAE
jgi:hypothetical protein